MKNVDKKFYRVMEKEIKETCVFWTRHTKTLAEQVAVIAKEILSVSYPGILGYSSQFNYWNEYSEIVLKKKNPIFSIDRLKRLIEIGGQTSQIGFDRFVIILDTILEEGKYMGERRGHKFNMPSTERVIELISPLL